MRRGEWVTSFPSVVFGEVLRHPTREIWSRNESPDLAKCMLVTCRDHTFSGTYVALNCKELELVKVSCLCLSAVGTGSWVLWPEGWHEKEEKVSETGLKGCRVWVKSFLFKKWLIHCSTVVGFLPYSEYQMEAIQETPGAC